MGLLVKVGERFEFDGGYEFSEFFVVKDEEFAVHSFVGCDIFDVLVAGESDCGVGSDFAV